MNTAHGTLELFFTFPLNENISYGVGTNILGVPSFTETETEEDVAGALSFEISYDLDSPDRVIYFDIYSAGTLVDSWNYILSKKSVSDVRLRLFVFNTRVSLYLNDSWVYSYAFYSIAYPSLVTKTITSFGGNSTINDVINVELGDGREAVWNDYESTSENAISSIIQERPIQIFPAVGRAYEFTYDATKSEILAAHVSSYEIVEQDNSASASDALVYSFDVGFAADERTAEELGFITRLYRLPEIDSGVDRAVGAIQKKARESRFRLSMTMRFDPRIEIGDILILDSLIVSGTNRALNERLIVEDVNMRISDGQYTSTVGGRREVDEL